MIIVIALQNCGAYAQCWMCIDNHHVCSMMRRVSRCIVTQQWHFAVTVLSILSRIVVETLLSAGVFVLFGMSHLVGGLFVYFLLPETRGIPLEKVWLNSVHDTVLRQHSSVSAWLHKCWVKMDSMC